MENKMIKTNRLLDWTPVKLFAILILTLSVIAGVVFLFDNYSNDSAKAAGEETTGTISTISDLNGVLGGSFPTITIEQTTGITYPAVGGIMLAGCNDEIFGSLTGDSNTATWTVDNGAIIPSCANGGVSGTAIFSVFANQGDASNGIPVAVKEATTNITLPAEYAQIQSIVSDTTAYAISIRTGILDPNYFQLGLYFTENDENYNLQDPNTLPEEQIFAITNNNGTYGLRAALKPQIAQKLCVRILNLNSTSIPSSGNCRVLPISNAKIQSNSTITGIAGQALASPTFTIDPLTVPNYLIAQGGNIPTLLRLYGCTQADQIAGQINLQDSQNIFWEPTSASNIPSCATIGLAGSQLFSTTITEFNEAIIPTNISLAPNTVRISNADVLANSNSSTNDITINFDKMIDAGNTIHFYFADSIEEDPNPVDTPLQDLNNLPTNQKYSGQSPLVIPYPYGQDLTKICAVVVDENANALPNSGNCKSIVFPINQNPGNAMNTATLTNAGAIIVEEQPSTNTIRFDFTKNLSSGNTLHFYFANVSDSTPLQDLDNLPSNQKYSGQSPYVIPYTYGTTAVKACVVVVEPSGNRLPNSGNCVNVNLVAPESVVAISNANVSNGTCTGSTTGSTNLSIECSFPLTGGTSYELPSSGIQMVIDPSTYNTNTPSNCVINNTTLTCTTVVPEFTGTKDVKLYFGANSNFIKATVNSPILVNQSSSRTGKLYFVGSDNATPSFDLNSEFNTNFPQTQKFKDGSIKLVYDEIKNSSGVTVAAGTCNFKLYKYGKIFNEPNVLKTYSGSITNGKCEVTFPVIDQTVNYYRVVVYATPSGINVGLPIYNMDTLILNVGGGSSSGNPTIEL
jgi:hypothetical protein